MRLGVFAKSFPRGSIQANLDAVRTCGFSCTQYNLSCASLPTLTAELSAELCRLIADAHRQRGLSMAAISGTFNIIDLDRNRLATNIDCLRVLAQNCSLLETDVITLCTGSCDADNMWNWHPQNATAQTWDRMIAAIHEIVAIAAENNVCVAIEPEINNVVDSALKARRLLEEIASPHLKVVFDAANLVSEEKQVGLWDVINEALDLLSEDIVLCHVKELNRPNAPQPHLDQLGTGLLDCHQYLRALARVGYDGPLIVHGIHEEFLLPSQQLLAEALATVVRQTSEAV
jgi:sugar phosphate isomerase/epimerase